MSRFMADCPHCGELFDDEDAWFEHGRLQAEAERLQAERAADKARIKLREEQRDAFSMHKMASRQCIGIPASVGVCEPVEGFAERPQDLAPAMREMALIIEADKARIAELEAALNHVRKELGIDWLHPCFDAARDALAKQGKEGGE